MKRIVKRSPGKTFEFSDHEVRLFLARLFHLVVCTDQSLTRIYLTVDSMKNADPKEQQRVFDEVKRVRDLMKKVLRTEEFQKLDAYGMVASRQRSVG